MKKSALALVPLSIALFAACNNAADAPKKAIVFPKPGTVVAAAEQPVTSDTLNHFTYAVKVVADSNVKAGEYDVDVDFGPNFSEGQFSMPKGAEDARPVIRKGDAQYDYIIGFKIAGDSTFYDYFEVTSDKEHTKMQYIKAYSF